MLVTFLLKIQRTFDHFFQLDFLAPIALRIYLVPIFYMAGMNKVGHIQDVASWFQHGLHLPYPLLMAYLAAYTELLGAICLAFGFALRWMCIPLIITMLVAAFAVHWDNGWMAIAGQHTEASQRLTGFLTWLKHNHPGRHSFVTEFGKPVILNNGIEFAITYLVMLLSLFFTGAGNYFSVDYWLRRHFIKKDGLKSYRQ